MSSLSDEYPAHSSTLPITSSHGIYMPLIQRTREHNYLLPSQNDRSNFNHSVYAATSSNHYAVIPSLSSEARSASSPYDQVSEPALSKYRYKQNGCCKTSKCLLATNFTMLFCLFGVLLLHHFRLDGIITIVHTTFQHTENTSNELKDIKLQQNFSQWRNELLINLTNREAILQRRIKLLEAKLQGNLSEWQADSVNKTVTDLELKITNIQLQFEDMQDMLRKLHGKGQFILLKGGTHGMESNGNVAKTGSIKYWHIASDVASYKEIFNIDNINDIGTVTLLKHGNYLIFACITIVMQPAYNDHESVSYYLQLDSHIIASCTIPGRIVAGYVRAQQLPSAHIKWLSGSCQMTTAVSLHAGDQLVIEEESVGYTRPADFHISKVMRNTYWGIVAI